MPSSPMAKRLILLALVAVVSLFFFGAAVGAVGSKLLGTESLLETPEVHLPSQAIFPEAEREAASRGGLLGYTGFALTNTMLSSFVTTAVLLLVFVVGTARRKMVPGRLQGMVELIIEGLLTFVEGVAGKGMGRKFFPIIATIFLFVLFNAWMGLLPIYPSLGLESNPKANLEFIAEVAENKEMHLHGVVASFSAEQLVLEDGTVLILESETHVEEDLAFGNEAVGKKVKVESIKNAHGELLAEHIEIGEAPRVHLLRAAGTDVNMTLALAIVAFIFVEFWGLRTLKFAYLGKFIRVRGFFQSPKGWFNAGVDLFVGCLEGLSEFIRLVSFTFRLFGNMLAGEILILVSAFLFPFVIGVVFYGLELLVGLIQAVIFAGLTLTFATMAVVRHDEH